MIKQPETIKIMLDYLQGPIWMSDSETGEPITGIEIIDTDPLIKELNLKCSELYNGYFEFDSHDQPCWFNHEKEKAEKNIMLDLISQIKKRLEEINDGSFIIEDLETDRLSNL